LLEPIDITAVAAFKDVAGSITRTTSGVATVAFVLNGGASRLIDCRKELQFRMMVVKTADGTPFTDRDDR
jgi:hypothetical protein